MRHQCTNVSYETTVVEDVDVINSSSDGVCISRGKFDKPLTVRSGETIEFEGYIDPELGRLIVERACVIPRWKVRLKEWLHRLVDRI